MTLEECGQVKNYLNSYLMIKIVSTLKWYNIWHYCASAVSYYNTLYYINSQITIQPYLTYLILNKLTNLPYPYPVGDHLACPNPIKLCFFNI